jgi:hypothetical protein
MLRELRVSEMRYRAVLEVLDGAVLNLEDRSSRPHGCPHQMAPELEAADVSSSGTCLTNEFR